MSKTSWQDIKLVIEEALELEQEAVGPYLDERCGDDEGLRLEVERLLRLKDRASPLLDKPFFCLLGNYEAPIDQRLDGYRLLQRIGLGGMGEVFRAEEVHPRRLVAVKMIRAAVDGGDFLARFEREQEVLASLNHPNIAQVYQVGRAADGSPFFAMELVEGDPVTKFCALKRLSLGQRIDLFLMVCGAVQHAHQNLVIHRDLKPSNILVRSENEVAIPKVIDFGVAKALGPGAGAKTETLAEQRVGTPEYMSPEQASVERKSVDIRADVYSLGVLLYRLLVGEVPFAFRRGVDGLETFLRRVREDEPTAPSVRLRTSAELSERAERRRTGPESLVREVRGDLDWIVLKSLEKEPDRRYPTTIDLMKDLRSFLAHKPVEAGPPSRIYRARKFFRRHRIAVAASVAVVVALIAGVVGASINLLRAREAERVAAREAARAVEEAARANQEALKAREISGFLVGLFEVSNPGEALGNSITARELLDAGAQRIHEELAEEPLVRAALMDTMGVVYHSLGLFESAEPLLEEALEVRKARLGRSHLDVAETLNHFGELRRLQSRYAEARTMLAEALRIREEIMGAETPEVADTLNSLALLSRNQGRLREAAELMERAASIREARPDRELASILSNLSIVYRDLGQWARATVPLERALALFQAELGSEHPDYNGALNNLAELYRKLGRLSEAEATHLQVLETNLRVLGSEHPNVAVTLNNLGVTAREQGKYAEAEEFYRRCLEIDRKVFGEEHPYYAIDVHNLGVLYRHWGKLRESERLLFEALAMRRRLFGAEHPHIADSYSNLGDLFLDLGALDQAEDYYEQALELRRRLLGDRHPRVAVTLSGQSKVFLRRGRAEEAEAMLFEAVAIREESYGAEHPLVAESLEQLGDVYLKLGMAERAIPRLARSVAIRERSLGAGHELVAAALAKYGRALRLAGREKEAEFVERRIAARP